MVKSVYILQTFYDHPQFSQLWFDPKSRSLLGRDCARSDFEKVLVGGKWKYQKFGRKWVPQTLRGTIPAFQDFSDADGVPVFSSRAVDALGPALRSSGELLRVITDGCRSEYFVYQSSNVMDVLDTARASVIPKVDVDYFSFHKERITKDVFRIPEKQGYVLVTDEFAKAATDAGLNGFNFVKVWPFKKGTSWRNEEAQRRRKAIAANAVRKSMRRETVVICFELKGPRMSSRDKKQMDRFQDELDAQLVATHPDATYFGRVEGLDVIDGEACLFLTCPNAEALAEKLAPWLANLKWRRPVHLVQRKGDMYSETAEETIRNVK